MYATALWEVCLPVEICEVVIEFAGSPPYFGTVNACSHYAALLVCALVCSDWLPTSRRMLYRRVHLPSEPVTSLFVRTLAAQRFLADLVHEVEIEGLYQPWIVPGRQYRRSSYISFTHGFLLRHLRRMDTLNLYNLDIAKDYPPVFPSLIVRFPLRQLTLWNCSLPLSSVFRIIWSLDSLHSLTLHYDIHPSDPAAIASPSSSFASECEKLQMMHLRRPRRCQKLRRLTLGGIYVQSRAFPPPGVFGTQLTHVYVALQRGRVEYNPNSVLEPEFGLHADFFATLPLLELFHVQVNMAVLQADKTHGNYRRFISATLSALTAVTSLHILSMKAVLFCSSLDPRDRPSRSDVAQHLCYKGILEQLKILPRNVRIYVCLEDGLTASPSPASTEQWHQLIGDLLPGLHHRLYVHIHYAPPANRLVSERVPSMPEDGMSEADVIHVQNRRLWLEYAKTVPKPPPLEPRTHADYRDPRAFPALINTSRYDFRPQHPGFRVPPPFYP